VKITRLIWQEEIVEKLERKHHVSTEEVKQVFMNQPRFLFRERGRRVADEDLYNALGQTDSGRYVAVFFLYKRKGVLLLFRQRYKPKGEKILCQKVGGG
jgi:uncharacterized DUF497 family protein